MKFRGQHHLTQHALVKLSVHAESWPLHCAEPSYYGSSDILRRALSVVAAYQLGRLRQEKTPRERVDTVHLARSKRIE